MSAFVLVPVDFIFEFQDTAINAGEAVQTGQTGDYYWRSQNNSGATAYSLDNESVAEIAGIEIYGPNNRSYRSKLRYVRPVIDGRELETISINELMAPGLSYERPDPLAAAGMRYGQACTNLGKPMLVGGSPWEATPKIGPGEDLSIKVSVPRTTEGGAATVSRNMVVRVWLAQVKGEKKLTELLNYHGHLNSRNQVDCSFELGDLETSETMPLRSYKTNNPIQKIVPETREFSMVDWTRLPGGNDCDKPNVSCYVTYAQNAAATTANDWYQFTQDGSRVGYDWQELLWNLDKKNAIMITHLGMLPHQNIRYLRLYRSGRAIENVHYVGPDVCNFPMPAQPYTTADGYAGPAKLARNYLVWNEKGSIEVKDNGTSVAAWSASDVGTMIAVYGKEYELTGE